MSGTEALAALGLACNVFQVISFTSEVCTTCKTIFENGKTPGSSAHLSDAARSLSEICESIKESTDSATWPLSKNDYELLNIAKECNKAASALKLEAEKAVPYASAAKGKLLMSVVEGFKLVVRSKSRKLERLEKMLQTHQSSLESRLLSNCW
jgi:hypothetical protein